MTTSNNRTTYIVYQLASHRGEPIWVVSRRTHWLDSATERVNLLKSKGIGYRLARQTSGREKQETLKEWKP